MTRPFSLIPPQSEAEPAHLYIYGDIEEGEAWWDSDTTPLSVLLAIKACPGNEMTVHINSYGGYTSAGIAIYNTLKECGKTITTICEGFACSSASLIFMAGSKRIMRKSSLLMIHNAWTMADGNADQLRKTADDLDVISAATGKIYEDNCELSAEEIKTLMDAETWIDADTAMSYGMCTEITGDVVEEPDENGVLSTYSSAFGAIRAKLLAQALPEITEETVVETQVYSAEEPEEPAGILEGMETMLHGIQETVNEILATVRPGEPESTEPEQETTETAFSRLFGNFK